MNKIKIIFLLFAAILFYLTTMFYAIKAVVKTKKENKTLKGAMENQKKNLIYIVRHSQELADIASSRSKVDKELSEAKSDEEVVNIINTIIDTNNNRVRNNKSR